MVTLQEIQKIFPELEWINDTSLREKVIKVWFTAAERGGWKSLDDVPFTLLFEDSGLLTAHTRRVTRLAKNVMEAREENLNN
ncbi:MAG TPA: hypothetical protein ENI45_01595, partial [Thermoplasmatales archaeon]|nr:hypothetical protein [Thermoplasmatales archaeon]